MELQRALADIRLSRSPLDERLEELKQQYETVLSLLESQFLGALLSGDWSEFDQFVKDFRCPQTQPTITEDRDDDRNAEASPKSLSGSGADLCESQVQNSN
jgi:hypothetical protein